MRSADLTRDFRAYTAERNLRSARLGSVLVIMLMPSGVLLDYFSYPDHVPWFLTLRAIGCVAGLLWLGATYLPSAPRFAFLAGAAPTLSTALVLDVMIESTGGYTSPYYAGLSLLMLGVGFMFTWTGMQTLAVCGGILLIWLLPTAARASPIELGPFVNNLFFLVLTSVVAVASNASRRALALRELEAQSGLAAALERLRQLDKLKNKFFANISHELRTPLTLIIAPLQRLLSGALPPDTRHELLAITRNSERLLRLIDELLDLSRLDVGGLRLTIAQLDLPALASGVLEASRPGAAAADIQLHLEVRAAPAEVFGDAHRVESILTNLLGNAIKYVPAGGRISVVVDAVDGGGMVEVADNGPGIPADDLPHVFERFYQVMSTDRRSAGGVGIGLALARELAELHNGTLTATSEQGVGSVFRLWLPPGRDHFRSEVVERRKRFVPTPTPQRTTDPSHGTLDADRAPEASPERRRDGVAHGRVLLVDDQAELRAFIASLLRPTYDVLEAEDGIRGLDLVRSERPDLVVCDIMMPGLEGTDLCRAIKTDPDLKHTPVILLTARVGSETTLDAYAHGADDFVAKPFHPDVLLARVRAQLELRAMAIQLASQEKLLAVGTLAAGIAHEIKNPINSVLTAAQLLANEEAPPRQPARLAQVVLDGVSRIRGIVEALETNVRPAEGVDSHRPCNLKDSVESALLLLAHRTHNVAVHTTYDTARPVKMPAGPAGQVIVNLLDNAILSGARTVWITVAARDEHTAALSVRDDGPGVPRARQSRIFDPFFTTRDPGSGTGLGLYICRRMARSYGGDLVLTPTDAGAEFVLQVPFGDSP